MIERFIHQASLGLFSLISLSLFDSLKLHEFKAKIIGLNRRLQWKHERERPLLWEYLKLTNGKWKATVLGRFFSSVSCARFWLQEKRARERERETKQSDGSAKGPQDCLKIWQCCPMWIWIPSTAQQSIRFLHKTLGLSSCIVWNTVSLYPYWLYILEPFYRSLCSSNRCLCNCGRHCMQHSKEINGRSYCNPIHRSSS